jgi:hypothetical protein
MNPFIEVTLYTEKDPIKISIRVPDILCYRGCSLPHGELGGTRIWLKDIKFEDDDRVVPAPSEDRSQQIVLTDYYDDIDEKVKKWYKHTTIERDAYLSRIVPC